MRAGKSELQDRESGPCWFRDHRDLETLPTSPGYLFRRIESWDRKCWSLYVPFPSYKKDVPVRHSVVTIRYSCLENTGIRHPLIGLRLWQLKLPLPTDLHRAADRTMSAPDCTGPSPFVTQLGITYQFCSCLPRMYGWGEDGDPNWHYSGYLGT